MMSLIASGMPPSGRSTFAFSASLAAASTSSERSAPADPSPSFHNFRDDKKAVRFSGRIAQRLLCRKPVARRVLPENIENWKSVRGRFYMASIRLAKFFNILQHITQLLLKGVRFLLCQVDPRQSGDVRDIEIRSPCHGVVQECRLLISQMTAAASATTRRRKMIWPSRRSLRIERGRRALLLSRWSCAATETRNRLSLRLSFDPCSVRFFSITGTFATSRSSFSSLSRSSASCRAISSCLRRSGGLDLRERRNIAITCSPSKRKEQAQWRQK